MISPDFIVIGMRPLAFLLFSHWIDDVQSGLRDWDQVILNSHLREGPEIKSHHICSDLLLF